jgi:hypothetical protein
MMDPFARELLDETRHAHDPSPEDRLRVRAKLAARIGAGALASGGLTKKALASSGLSLIIKLVVPVALLGTVGWYLLRGPEAPEAPRVGEHPAAVSASAPSADPRAPGSPTLEEPASPAPTPPDLPSPTMTPVGSAPRVTSLPAAASHSGRPQPSADLEAEMGLLTSAQAAIQRGDYSAALAKLDEHQKAFPSGVLSEERTAARIVALCAAGRQADARSLATAFLARHPSSPLAPRVRTSCGGP